MNLKLKKTRGFIVIYSLMIISLLVLLTHQLLNGVFTMTNFVTTTRDREQARMLALSGVAIATQQLKQLDKKPKKDKDKDNKKDEEEEKAEKEAAEDDKPDAKKGKDSLSAHDKKFFAQILPFLNRWRSFSFEEKNDGFNGTLQLCVCCEEGKININKAFDFKKQDFRKEYAALLKSLEIKGKLKAGELAAQLKDFLTKRKRKLEDVSELSLLPACQNLDIFYTPPYKPTKKGEEARPASALALSDIFTVWTMSHEINPLLFSDGLCAMFAFRRPLANDPEKMKERFKQFKEKFRPSMAKEWDASWGTLQILYDKKPVFFKEMQGVFSKEFGPRTYSVISYATVGRVTQRVVAIVKKVEKPQEPDKKAGAVAQKPNPAGPQQGNGADGKKEKVFEFKVLRMYWI